MIRFTSVLGLAAAVLVVLTTGHSVSAQTRIQILHASDLEGGVDAISDAPNFGAVVEALELDASNASIPSLLLSAGDNYIPGPFFSAAGDLSVRTALRTATGNLSAREGVGRADITIMNILGFDASALGNHEFDATTGILQSIIATDIRDGNGDGILDDPRWLGAQFPYLSSNLDFSGDSALAGLYTGAILPSTAFQSTLADLAAASTAPKLASSAIVQRGGETFGIVGATTPLLGMISSPGDTSVKNPGAGTNDMAALAGILQPVIDALTSSGVDKIILVTHLQQITLEQQLVPLLNNVDIAIAGGSDTLLADAGDRLRTGDVAAGNYPLYATNGNGQPAAIVSTDGQYRYLGRLVIDFDAAGVIIPSSVNATESGAYATDDQGVQDLWGDLVAPFQPGTKGSQVKGLTDAVRTVVVAKDGNVFGKASVYLEGRRAEVRTEETNLGNLTADANLFVARCFDSSVLVSHKNGGGIRDSIGALDGTTGAELPTLANPEAGKNAGEISQLDIENSLRFNNQLSLITLTRAQLKEVLEHAVAGTAPGATPGQFGQFGGIVFSFDPSRAVGDRVRRAGIITPGCQLPFFVVNGRVIGNGNVRMVTLNFLADGGDGYPFPGFVAANPVLANRVDLATAGLPIGSADFAGPGTEQDALAEFLAAKHAVQPYSRLDKSASHDLRIQNLDERNDRVIVTVALALIFGL